MERAGRLRHGREARKGEGAGASESTASTCLMQRVRCSRRPVGDAHASRSEAATVKRPGTGLLFQFERNRRQWRQVNQYRMLAAHPLSIFALRATVIADVAAAVGFGIGIDDLAIKSGRRNAEPVS